MNKNFARVGAVTAIVAAAVVGLTACSATTPTPDSSSTAIGSGVVSPIQIPVADANGMVYEIPMNSMGYLNVPESTEADWTGETATDGVVTFTKGGSDGDATLVPGLTPVAPGETGVTMTNTVTGESVTFTVVVTP